MSLVGRLLQGFLCPGFLSALAVGLLCRGLAAWLGAKLGRRPARPVWQPLEELVRLAGKSPAEHSGQLTPVVWAGLLGLVALSWALGMLPWPRWPWAMQELPGDWMFYLVLLSVPPLVRLVVAGLSEHPMAALGARRQAPLEIARLLPLMLAGAAWPLFTGQVNLSQQVPLALPGVLIGGAVVAILLATLPWSLWDHDEHNGYLAGLGGRFLAVLRALEALEIAAQIGLIAVVLRASSFFPPGCGDLVPAIAFAAVTVGLATLEWGGRRLLLPEAARYYTRWVLPVAVLVTVLGWWLGLG